MHYQQIQYLIADDTQQLLITPDELRRQIDELLSVRAARYRRLWTYYRNPLLPRGIERDEQGSDRPYRQGQEWGLPSRITGVRVSGGAGSFSSEPAQQPVQDVARKEVVIENDIGWRIDTMVDFLFGRGVAIRSGCDDPARRAQIESLLAAVLEHNGGMVFLQHLALLGAVYGHVDVLVKFDPQAPGNREQSRTDRDLDIRVADPDPARDAAPPASPGDELPSSCPDASDRLRTSATAESAPKASAEAAAPHPAAIPPTSFDIARAARAIRLEIVEPARALPVLCPTDWRRLRAFVQVFELKRSERVPFNSPRSGNSRWLRRLLGQLASSGSNGQSQTFVCHDQPITVVEVLTTDRWQRYEDGHLVAQGINSLGRIPLVHVQNLPVPFQYGGTSDVEPLVPLQDELNTRLSDRANRIVLQSFKMYLGKGIEGFTSMPVAPGRMWMTDNESASIEEFGGEASCPSEDLHVQELREAMDKHSGVTPIAAGAVRGRIGHLTSAAALRVTMLALLARTQRKRLTYGQAIAQICELALAWLDRAGVFKTTAQERRVHVEWREPLEGIL
ncbi:hypothetical protein [Fontivita pretiosa]|uniref:hypothetical protein n=1 Tax=Fontivita pretiosa TaxID=2989684 RepID=UPI003D1627BD